MKHFWIIIFVSLLAAAQENEELIIDLEQSLMAPCCWSGTVFDHGNKELETKIRLLVADGETKQEVLDHFVQVYGERILAIPVAQGFNIMAWIAPVIIAIAALTVLGLYLRTPRKIIEKSQTAHQEESSIPYNEQIEKELQDLD
ncbi:MAG TPA: cytochrome c-type biogenesis protein CcmH [Candidatus Marinimicrobia bacterium]|jgi:cytochrome c-type biogenesis protein CcmH|nr:hypothetical protein [Candidatus Neomarinimicrobiota bacterium]MDP6276255.1 cytochrome c-type biogenesis protein CcmH [Candidatus Neomarinimicrobiota bacterium]MDP7330689.1 cytochrome c-type biogenesis protein CcmH [Candidatus Neomarinimicrobiota bacterium]HBN45260.1 hypothetical protein [Candidatus Neomarinimicrobiota bacterium]HJL75348.1 cytochrome c-type biogenesis protein CcmH [Candidatus Neomarinimicrobiota bacterium]|tara:strand:- start:32287 stop:32718 length:432 start_codon:yes stop_codon:yes gene_type:complete